VRSHTSDSLRVIAHADDLGMSHRVNSAIERALQQGLLSSVSIMANGIAFNEGVQIVQRFPHVSVGAHLNLSEFAALTGPTMGASFVDTSGAFRLRPKPWLSRLDRDRAVREWQSQVERIRAAGIELTHIDSHHHVHTLPMLFPVLKRVQKATGIARVRTTRNMPRRLRSTSSLIKSATKVVWQSALREIAPRAICTDLFGSVSDFIEASTVRDREWWTGRVIEIMCHPGHPSVEFRAEMHELEAGLLTSADISLISYAELSG